MENEIKDDHNCDSSFVKEEIKIAKETLYSVVINTIILVVAIVAIISSNKSSKEQIQVNNSNTNAVLATMQKQIDENTKNANNMLDTMQKQIDTNSAFATKMLDTMQKQIDENNVNAEKTLLKMQFQIDNNTRQSVTLLKSNTKAIELLGNTIIDSNKTNTQTLNATLFTSIVMNYRLFSQSKKRIGQLEGKIADLEKVSKSSLDQSTSSLKTNLNNGANQIIQNNVSNIDKNLKQSNSTEKMPIEDNTKSGNESNTSNIPEKSDINTLDESSTTETTNINQNLSP